MFRYGRQARWRIWDDWLLHPRIGGEVEGGRGWGMGDFNAVWGVLLQHLLMDSEMKVI
jgi:hypothetical protein